MESIDKEEIDLSKGREAGVEGPSSPAMTGSALLRSQ